MSSSVPDPADSARRETLDGCLARLQALEIDAASQQYALSILVEAIAKLPDGPTALDQAIAVFRLLSAEHPAIVDEDLSALMALEIVGHRLVP